MQKTLLITGSNGLLGQKLLYNLIRRNTHKLVATSRGPNRLKNTQGYKYFDLDITDKESVNDILKLCKPDVIIHTAAMTNVDQCELNHEDCDELNVEAVSNLINAIKENQLDSHFIHLSTDFIFDGKSGPYKEEDVPAPISYYGESKLKAEKLVQQSGLKWAIARTVLVYGIVDEMSRSNIVLWAKNALEKGQPINVVNDQFRTPTLAEDLAEGCILIADKQAEGIFNISGGDFMSVLELVNRVADFFKLDKSIVNPSTSEGIKQPAKRPPITGFDISKARSILSYKPHSFEEGLQILAQQIKFS